MLELAANYGAGPLQIRLIAQRQNISVKYLEQLMVILRSAGFVRSVRGARGGYLLTRPPGEINVNELFGALEGPVVIIECVEDNNYCARIVDCIARNLWVQVQKAVETVLKSMNLQDLLNMVSRQHAPFYQI